MFILNLLLKITGFTQEELANYVNVSRASINSWLTDDSGMSENSKRNIADKFEFPISYFDIDLNQNISVYKLIFSTLYENWKRVNKTQKQSNEKLNRINEIFEEMDIDFDCCVSDYEILDGLLNGYNPFTGEMFENDHILNKKPVKSLISKLKNSYMHTGVNTTKEDLNSDQRELFEEFRKWRKDKQNEEGFFKAYMVFTDKELINIIIANINRKEDLFMVKGIGNVKYNKYGDEIFDILIKKKYAPTNRGNKYNNYEDEFVF